MYKNIMYHQERIKPSVWKTSFLLNVILLAVILIFLNYITKGKLFKTFNSGIKKMVSLFNKNMRNDEEINQIKHKKTDFNFVYSYKESEEEKMLNKLFNNLKTNIIFPLDVVLPKQIHDTDKKSMTNFLQNKLNSSKIKLVNLKIGSCEFKKYKNDIVEIKPFNVKGLCLKNNIVVAEVDLSISLMFKPEADNKIFISTSIFQGFNGTFTIYEIELKRFKKINDKYQYNRFINTEEVDNTDLDSLNLDTINSVDTFNSVDSMIPSIIDLSSEYEEDSEVLTSEEPYNISNNSLSY